MYSRLFWETQVNAKVLVFKIKDLFENSELVILVEFFIVYILCGLGAFVSLVFYFLEWNSFKNCVFLQKKKLCFCGLLFTRGFCNKDYFLSRFYYGSFNKKKFVKIFVHFWKQKKKKQTTHSRALARCVRRPYSEDVSFYGRLTKKAAVWKCSK